MALTHETKTERLTDTISKTLTVPADTSVVTYVFGAFLRSSPTTREFTLSSATLGGVPMTNLADDFTLSSNRYYRQALWKFSDPYGTLGTTSPVVSVTTSRGCSSLSLIVVHVTGVTDTGTPKIKIAEASTPDDSVSDTLTGLFSPSTILSFGWVRFRTAFMSDNYAGLAATGDLDLLVKTHTGTDEFSDLVTGLGYIDSNSPASHAVGFSWPSPDIYGLITVEIAGALSTAGAIGGADSPDIVFGDASLDDLEAASFGGASIGAVSISSTPPVQVVGKGNLYFVTSARNLSVVLLATTGAYWPIVTPAHSVEQLGVQITRRKGYLIPR